MPGGTWKLLISYQPDHEVTSIFWSFPRESGNGPHLIGRMAMRVLASTYFVVEMNDTVRVSRRIGHRSLSNLAATPIAMPKTA